MVDPPRHRSARERVRGGLAFLGYAPLSESTWISPFVSPGVEELLSAEDAVWSRLRALDEQASTRARQAWDLDSLADAYVAWRDFAERLLADPRAVLGGLGGADDDEEAFAVRSVLVHEWRKFLFTDPGLPAELLPPTGSAHEAARFFAGGGRPGCCPARRPSSTPASTTPAPPRRPEPPVTEPSTAADRTVRYDVSRTASRPSRSTGPRR